MWDPVILNELLGCKLQLDCSTETPLPSRGRIHCRNHWIWVCLCCSTPISGAAECLSCCKEIRVGICNKWVLTWKDKNNFKISGRKEGRYRKIISAKFFCMLLHFPSASFSWESPAMAAPSAYTGVGCTHSQSGPNLIHHLDKSQEDEERRQIHGRSHKVHQNPTHPISVPFQPPRISSL